MTTSATPSQESNVRINMLRVKILTPMDALCLVDHVSAVVGGESATPGKARYGYAKSTHIHCTLGDIAAIIYHDHKHPSAYPCVELLGQVDKLYALKRLSQRIPTEVTASTVQHKIRYLSTSEVVDRCCSAIVHKQGKPDYLSMQTRTGENSKFTFEREGSLITVEFEGLLKRSESSTVTISVNPEPKFRSLLTSRPIAGAWGCTYWTRTLSMLLFGKVDPLSTEFALLFGEPLHEPDGGSPG